MVDVEYIDTNVGKVQLRRGGSGTALVYLHSAQGEGEGLPFLEELAGRAKLIAPMFPGFGESLGIEQIEDMEDAVFHLLDVFDRLGLTAPVVVGSSLGGWMALELATRYPERVGKLVLVNAAGLYLPGAEIKDIFGTELSEMVKDMYFDRSHPMAQMMLSFAAISRDKTSEIPFDLIKPLYQSMAATARLAWDPYLHNPKLRRRLGRITAPTLVIRAEFDSLIPAPHAEVFASEIPGARLHIIDKAAHMVMIERPDVLAQAIADFVA